MSGRDGMLADGSRLGRILASGPDILDLLNRLSTREVTSLSANGGCTTVLTSPKGRILHRLFVHHLGDDGILLVAGPGEAPSVRAHLDRFTLAERTGLKDVTAEWGQWILAGPRARDILSGVGIPAPDSYGVAEGEIQGTPVRILGQDSFSTDGFSLLFEAGHAPAVREVLNAAGASIVDPEALEAWRILRGYPAPGHELTEEHNPLEAGLWDAVSFDKGCYVGQEVVARLKTYDKVARSIRGLVFEEGSSLPEAGAPLFVESRRAGEVTSSVVPPGRSAPVALAYVKRGFDAAGTVLRVGEDEARVVDLPFE